MKLLLLNKNISFYCSNKKLIKYKLIDQKLYFSNHLSNIFYKAKHAKHI